jgi:hypothetical protein
VLSKINESDYIVGYVEHGRQDGTLYLLMDYVEATNLKDAVRAAGSGADGERRANFD